MTSKYVADRMSVVGKKETGYLRCRGKEVSSLRFEVNERDHVLYVHLISTDSSKKYN